MRILTIFLLAAAPLMRAAEAFSIYDLLPPADAFVRHRL